MTLDSSHRLCSPSCKKNGNAADVPTLGDLNQGHELDFEAKKSWKWLLNIIPSRMNQPGSKNKITCAGSLRCSSAPMQPTELLPVLVGKLVLPSPARWSSQLSLDPTALAILGGRKVCLFSQGCWLCPGNPGTFLSSCLASGVVTGSPGQMEWELLSETGCLLGAWSPVAPPPPTHPQALFWLLPLSDLSFFSINT